MQMAERLRAHFFFTAHTLNWRSATLELARLPFSIATAHTAAANTCSLSSLVAARRGLLKNDLPLCVNCFWHLGAIQGRLGNIPSSCNPHSTYPGALWMRHKLKEANDIEQPWTEQPLEINLNTSFTKSKYWCIHCYYLSPESRTILAVKMRTLDRLSFWKVKLLLNTRKWESSHLSLIILRFQSLYNAALQLHSHLTLIVTSIDIGTQGQPKHSQDQLGSSGTFQPSSQWNPLAQESSKDTATDIWNHQ